VQCYLKIGEQEPEGIKSPQARKAFMKANMDAGLAAELAPDYAKAHYRKGLSLVRRRLANAPTPTTRVGGRRHYFDLLAEAC
jgi:hypothetical protein